MLLELFEKSRASLFFFLLAKVDCLIKRLTFFFFQGVNDSSPSGKSLQAVE